MTRESLDLILPVITGLITAGGVGGAVCLSFRLLAQVRTKHVYMRIDVGVTATSADERTDAARAA